MPKKTGLFIIGGLLVCLAAVLLYSTTREQERAVLMKIATIKGNHETSEMVVILQETEGQRLLPISIGHDQALAIHLGHQKIPAPRPLTHDLMAEILKAANLKVERVVITALKEGTYYSQVLLKDGGKAHPLDARPSDAIALSLRVNAPIYVMPELLQDVPGLTLFDDAPPNTEIAAWGFTVQTLTPGLSKYFGSAEGVLIADVSKDGPGERGGLLAGDLLVRVDELTVQNVQNFVDHIAAHDSSQSLKVEIARGRERHNLVITQVK